MKDSRIYWHQQQMDVIYYLYSLLLFFVLLSIFIHCIVFCMCARLSCCKIEKKKEKTLCQCIQRPAATDQEWTREEEKRHVVKNVRSLKFANCLPFRHFFRKNLGSRDVWLCWCIWCVCVLLRTHGCRKSATAIILYNNIRFDGWTLFFSRLLLLLTCFWLRFHHHQHIVECTII